MQHIINGNPCHCGAATEPNKLPSMAIPVIIPPDLRFGLHIAPHTFIEAKKGGVMVKTNHFPL
jgi:hypothetical protein